jgi:hypothetical protein
MPLYPNDAYSGSILKRVRVNATADGDNAVITAVTGKKILVTGYVLTVTLAGLISVQDTAGSPVVHAQFSLATNGGVSYAGSLESAAFLTAAGTGVEVNNPAGVDTHGHMTYAEVD